MAKNTLRRLTPVPPTAVTIDDGFWAPRREVNRAVTLPIEYEQCRKTGRIDAFRIEWKPGQPDPPHKFWDSDVAKWVEAASYSLATNPAPELAKTLDEVVDLIVGAQQPDGYLNVHFTVVEPEKRWTNLRTEHELYCAGHLMEAAVAHHEATGSRKLLDALCRYADHIDSVFGPEEGKKRGYPGHEEIELALAKLYRVTGQQRYIRLAQFFIDERGRQPHYFDIEAKARGEDTQRQWFQNTYGSEFYYGLQAHLPVREQQTAVGHAVRAMYLYSGMADVALETGDRTLLKPLHTLWRNVTRRRMYVTGGVGSARDGERFTFDYDLPNDLAYTETCAAIGLVLWAHRMLQLELDGDYADVMERALYNGVISGISLDGRRFFYTNPLAVHPEACEHRKELERIKTERQEWFGCACCPPNIARLLADLGRYFYSVGDRLAAVHLYVQGRVELEVGGRKVVLVQKTGYPWREKIRITVSPDAPAEFTLALRLPSWCRKPAFTINGRRVALGPITRKGYALLKRRWARGDRVELTLPMRVERVEANPRVRHDGGYVALQRGPVVYCLEEVDNGPDLNDLVLPPDAKLTARFERELLGGCTVIRGAALRRDANAWKDQLYGPGPTKRKRVSIRTIPYALWTNRRPGEMLVWIRQG